MSQAAYAIALEHFKLKMPVCVKIVLFQDIFYSLLGKLWKIIFFAQVCKINISESSSADITSAYNVAAVSFER